MHLYTLKYIVSLIHSVVAEEALGKAMHESQLRGEIIEQPIQFDGNDSRGRMILKDLVSGMIIYNPGSRPNIDTVVETLHNIAG